MPRWGARKPGEKQFPNTNILLKISGRNSTFTTSILLLHCASHLNNPRGFKILLPSIHIHLTLNPEQLCKLLPILILYLLTSNGCTQVTEVLLL
jgi:hypothetical protein